MKRRSLALTIVCLLPSCGGEPPARVTHAPSVVPSATAKGEPQEPARPRTRETPPAAPPDEDPFRLMKEEAIGPLRYGMTETEVRDVLGPPHKRSPRIEEGATGDYVEGWTFGKGISLGMRSDSPTGPLTVRSVVARAPSTLKTKRDVGIGSPRSDAMERYGADIEHRTTNANVVVAGSVYGGVQFITRGGVVRELFIGATSE